MIAAKRRRKRLTVTLVHPATEQRCIRVVVYTLTLLHGSRLYMVSEEKIFNDYSQVCHPLYRLCNQ